MEHSLRPQRPAAALRRHDSAPRIQTNEDECELSENVNLNVNARLRRAGTSLDENSARARDGRHNRFRQQSNEDVSRFLAQQATSPTLPNARRLNSPPAGHPGFELSRTNALRRQQNGRQRSHSCLGTYLDENNAAQGNVDVKAAVPPPRLCGSPFSEGEMEFELLRDNNRLDSHLALGNMMGSNGTPQRSNRAQSQNMFASGRRTKSQFLPHVHENGEVRSAEQAQEPLSPMQQPRGILSRAETSDNILYLAGSTGGRGQRWVSDNLPAYRQPESPRGTGGQSPRKIGPTSPNGVSLGLHKRSASSTPIFSYNGIVKDLTRCSSARFLMESSMTDLEEDISLSPSPPTSRDELLPDECREVLRSSANSKDISNKIWSEKAKKELQPQESADEESESLSSDHSDPGTLHHHQQQRQSKLYATPPLSCGRPEDDRSLRDTSYRSEDLTSSSNSVSSKYYHPVRPRIRSPSDAHRRGSFSETEEKNIDSRGNSLSDDGVPAAGSRGLNIGTKHAFLNESSTSPRAGKNVIEYTATSSSDSDDGAQVISGGDGFQHFRFGDSIGKGSFGTVYKVFDQRTGHIYAAKRIQLSDDPAKMRQLETEINVMKSLSHKHVVDYIGYSMNGSYMNIYLEFVAGGSLSQMIKSNEFFPEPLAVKFAKQITTGVAFLHKMNVLHRDIKAANVLLTTDGVAKLADFGTSLQVDQLESVGTFKSIRGSIPWMAPEMIKQSGISFPADIWSLGCTVLEMVTGTYPWPELTAPVSAMLHIANAKSGPTIPSTVSHELRHFMTQCFFIDPEKRFTAAQLMDHGVFLNTESL